MIITGFLQLFILFSLLALAILHSIFHSMSLFFSREYKDNRNQVNKNYVIKENTVNLQIQSFYQLNLLAELLKHNVGQINSRYLYNIKEEVL